MRERPSVVEGLADLGLALPALPVVDGVADDLMEAATRWPEALDALVEKGVRAGESLADELGVVLGALVGTLVIGPQDARRARPDWPAQRWAQWGAVRRVALGGGVMSGRLGERMLASAQDWLDRREVDVLLHLALPAQRLALRGARHGCPRSGASPSTAAGRRSSGLPGVRSARPVGSRRPRSCR